MDMEGRNIYPQYYNDIEETMIKREAGFTLVELMITMTIFVVFIAAASQVLTGLITQFKQQSKIAETNIEGIVGLEILRQDIEHAGYGLPWNLNGAAYEEIVVISETSWVDRDFNDGPPTNPARGTDPAGASNPPGGIRSGNGYALNGSDVLVVKAVNIARNDTCSKWTTLKVSPSFSNPYNPRQWTPASENLVNTDRVIVLSLGAQKVLNVSVSAECPSSNKLFCTLYSNVINSPWPPTDPAETRIVYGVDPNTDLRMPFNRADYYVRIPTTNMPQRCAPNTGIVRQADGGLNELPLLDCVADMEVIFGLDNDGDGDFEPGVGGSTDGYNENIFAFTAQQIRNQVRQVRVYILAHEGQMDKTFTFQAPVSPSSITVGEFGLGRNFDLSTITNWQNYRWKLYTIVVTPNDLR
jgi:prepilin-type N-terminal cleavage/methylation domain-containing protein